MVLVVAVEYSINLLTLDGLFRLKLGAVITTDGARFTLLAPKGYSYLCYGLLIFFFFFYYCQGGVYEEPYGRGGSVL